MAFNNAVDASESGFQSITTLGVWHGRTLIAGTGISITNGDGTAGNPVISATGGGGGGGLTCTTFDTSGTWTKAAGTTKIIVIGWNGGNGGGSGRRGTSTNAGGGGGAASNGGFYYEGPACIFGATETVTVGTGGAGGIAIAVDNTSGNIGIQGTQTSFGNLTAYVTGTLACGRGGVTAGAGTAATANNFNIYNESTVARTTQASANAGQPFSGSGQPPGSSGGLNSFLSPTAGGGGGGADSVLVRVGGAGGAYLSLDTTVLVAGSAGGIETGTVNGTIGSDQFTTGGIFIGGTGGGGGGGMKSIGPGIGGAGGIPGGGGGGGGGSLNGTNSGAGGAGGAGRVIVIEFTS
jgi:hypothetical protein